jgi:YebC/PmpR family DNA-binding regulatory protein
MAGHSAWKNIKHKKAANDKKRGKVWTKCSRAIIVAARAGGPDPAFNVSLRYAIDEAKAANMPKDTIEKAVKRGAGGVDSDAYVPVRYEGYGPGGVAIIVDCLSDNANRTAPEMRTIFQKHGGNLAKPGAVAFGFAPRGVLHIESGRIAEDRLMELALEAGADDVVEEEGAWKVTCEPTRFLQVKEAIIAAGVEPAAAELTMIPQATVACDEASGQTVMRLIEALEDHDDVQKVFSNADIPDAVLARAGS